MRRIVISFLFLLSISSIGCIGALGVNLFPDSRDIELGKQIDAEIRHNPKEYPILTGHGELKEYVESIGRRILESPAVRKRGMYAYTFEIIHDDSTINAFCTPGGYIYVYTGLLRFLDNEATLAGVLGHEIAHAERRHATLRMSSALGLQALLSIALGENPGQLAQVSGNLFAGLGLLVNSRSDETEADTYSMTYLQTTPYYPGAIRYFFDKVSAGSAGGKGSTFQRLLSTHPLPHDRIDHVENLLKKMGNPQPTEGNLFEIRYQQMKNRLP